MPEVVATRWSVAQLPGRGPHLGAFFGCTGQPWEEPGVKGVGNAGGVPKQQRNTCLTGRYVGSLAPLVNLQG